MQLLGHVLLFLPSIIELCYLRGKEQEDWGLITWQQALVASHDQCGVSVSFPYNCILALTGLFQVRLQ